MRSVCVSFVCVSDLQQYAMSAGVACRPLVQLLLSKGVDPTSMIPLVVGQLCPLVGMTPLHLLACYSFETAASAAGSCGGLDLSSLAKVAANSSAHMLTLDYLQHLGAVSDLLDPRGYNDGSYPGADCNAFTGPHCETPLTFAAMAGADAVITYMMKSGKLDLNLPRIADAVRPLDFAVAMGKASTAVILIEAGAEVRASTGYGQ
jgi:hypothetical protein